METITSFLTEDHRLADDLFASATQHAADGTWQECGRQLARFRAALETHMKLEEDVLFPAFEQATGNTQGPTYVMRHEHREMLTALDEIDQAAAAREAKRFASLTQSFVDVLDVHSAKEETILYPMCDKLVSTLNAGQLRQTLEELRRARS